MAAAETGGPAATVVLQEWLQNFEALLKLHGVAGPDDVFLPMKLRKVHGAADAQLIAGPWQTEHVHIAFEPALADGPCRQRSWRFLLGCMQIIDALSHGTSHMAILRPVGK